ncbi:hypothetical protein, partial [Halonatronomonas betaini]|uniref:hypothetical protein n=1 Tax=Halonatronomonas betaini TaxID=2778430 RepID=UPI0022E97243
RSNPGAIPEQSRSNPGAIPEQSRSNPGAILEKTWSNSGFDMNLFTDFYFIILCWLYLILYITHFTIK